MAKSKSKSVENPKLQDIREQIRNGHSPHLGFLHIPKTGGSGLNAFGRKLVARGYQFPCIFGHTWKVEKILTHFPEMRLCFILRDPLSKMISGFNSRLVQGRPTHNSLWSPREAAAFALFPSTRHLLDAIISDDEYQKSALNYAMRAIQHLRWNYSFYFKDLPSVKACASRFELIGDIASSADFIERMTVLSGAPAALAAELYQKRHVGKVRADDSLAGYDEQQISGIQHFLRDNTLIYQELLSIAGMGQKPA
jgi:hypothetical protein